MTIFNQYLILHYKFKHLSFFLLNNSYFLNFFLIYSNYYLNLYFIIITIIIKHLYFLLLLKLFLVNHFNFQIFLFDQFLTLCYVMINFNFIHCRLTIIITLLVLSPIIHLIIDDLVNYFYVFIFAVYVYFYIYFQLK